MFPTQKENLRLFYKDMGKLYLHVLIENPSYTTPNEMDPMLGAKGFFRHPIPYIRFLRFLKRPAKSLLQNYFDDPEILNFFDKMTSTYWYATVEEAPAIMAPIMFVDNHYGGSFYTSGSTLHLPGKLASEKLLK